jgi:hypothetical protein
MQSIYYTAKISTKKKQLVQISITWRHFFKKNLKKLPKLGFLTPFLPVFVPEN